MNTVDESRGRAAAIFDGEQGPQRDIALLNAAAALVVAGAAPISAPGCRVAAETRSIAARARHDARKAGRCVQRSACIGTCCQADLLREVRVAIG